jgi:hypothetical protein
MVVRAVSPDNEKRLVVQFKSTIPGLSSVASPQPASEFRPQWLTGPRFHAGFDRATALERASRHASTVRRCPGITDAMKTGYIVPLWVDVHVRFDGLHGEVDMQCASPWASVERHPIEQFQATPIEALASPYPCVFKLACPWRVHLPPGHSSWLMDAVYHRKWMGFSTIPGVVDHDRFHTSNIFLIWQRYDSGEMILPAGTPLFQIVPFARKKFELSVNDDSQLAAAERAAEDIRVGGWISGYRRLFRRKSGKP